MSICCCQWQVDLMDAFTFLCFFFIHFFLCKLWTIDCGLSMWGQIMISTYKLWLHGLRGATWTPMSAVRKRPLNLITLSLGILTSLHTLENNLQYSVLLCFPRNLTNFHTFSSLKQNMKNTKRYTCPVIHNYFKICLKLLRNQQHMLTRFTVACATGPCVHLGPLGSASPS